MFEFSVFGCGICELYVVFDCVLVWFRVRFARDDDRDDGYV